MKRLLPIVFIALSCCLQTGAQTIRHITISGHQRTLRQTIERELLFAAGSRLDSAQLGETERNLRSLPFLGKVAINVVPDGEHVDIDVRVEDLYARALSPLFSGSLDALNYGLIAVDYNFGGRGRLARIALEDRTGRGPRGQISLSDPRLVGATHGAYIDLALERDGHGLAWHFSRPYTTLKAPRTYGIRQWANRTPRTYYERGSLLHRYVTTSKGISLWYGISRGSHYKIRTLYEVRYADRTTLASLQPQPQFERQHRLQHSATITLWQPRYQRARFIANLGPVEDLQLGSWVSLSAGYAHAMDNADESFSFFSARLSPRWSYRHIAYVFATGSVRWQHNSRGAENTYLHADLRTYMRIGQTHSAAVRIRLDALHRPVSVDQFLLGLDTGLRAYSHRALSGKRRSTFSIEMRPTFTRTPWYVLAGAVFLDMGSAWNPPSNPFNLYYSAGIGLRAGLPKLYGTPVWRLDLAHAIRQHSWRLSIGFGQYF